MPLTKLCAIAVRKQLCSVVLWMSKNERQSQRSRKGARWLAYFLAATERRVQQGIVRTVARRSGDGEQAVTVAILGRTSLEKF